MPRLPQLLAAAAIWAYTSPGAADDEALRRIAALKFPLEERVTFVELRMHRLLRKPSEQRGTVWIGRDGELVMRIEAPLIEERRLHQGQLSLRRLKRRHGEDVDTALAQAPVRGMKLDLGRSAHLALAIFADVLHGDVESLNRQFNAVAVPVEGGSDNEWTIDLTPTNAPLHKTLDRIQLRGTGASLDGFEMRRGNKSWRRMRFFPRDPVDAFTDTL